MHNISQAVVSGEVATATYAEDVRRGVIDDRISSVSELDGHARHLVDRASKIADRVFGPVPEQGGGEPGDPPLNGTMDALVHGLMGLRDTLDRLQNEIDRLEAL